jgi:hypothetical protein
MLNVKEMSCTTPAPSDMYQLDMSNRDMQREPKLEDPDACVLRALLPLSHGLLT